jgi:hypothetical protein
VVFGEPQKSITIFSVFGRRIARRLLYNGDSIYANLDEEICFMATVENVRLAIKESAAKPGYSVIAYSYELHPSEQDCLWKREYTMSIDLWGEDLIDDDALAWDKDVHKVAFDDSGPCEPVKMERTFEVETKVLDEDLFGDDEVYLIVEARSGFGPDEAGEDPVAGRSNTVIGDF